MKTLSRTMLFGFFLFLSSLSVQLILVPTARFSDDEAEPFRVGKAIVEQKIFPPLGPILTGGVARTPGALFYYVVAISQLFSKTPESANVLVAIFGSLAVIFFWLALRPDFGEFGAAVAATAFAFSPWHILFSDHIWNPCILGFFTSVALWAAVRVRHRPESALVALLIFICAALPQFHLSTPILWCSFAFLVKDGVRSWKKKWIVIGLAGAILLYGPYLHYELTTNFSNVRNYLADGAGKHRSTSFRNIPIYALSFLTLSTADFELMGYWGRYPQWIGVVAAFTGTEVRPFHPARLALLLVSLVMAGWALRETFRPLARENLWYRDYRNAILGGIVADMVLLGLAGKVVYSHYVQGLLPILFVMYAYLAKRAQGIYRQWLVVALVFFCLGGIEASLSISRRLDSRNGLFVERQVLETLLLEKEPVWLEFGFHSSLPPYEVLAREQYGVQKIFDPKSSKRFYLGKRDEFPTRDLTLVNTVGTVSLYRRTPANMQQK